MTKIVKTDGHAQRTVLMGMIVDDAVLAAVSSVWSKDMFASRWANIVGNWCVDWYKRHNTAPRESLEHLYCSWAEGQSDSTEVNLVNKFVKGLDTDYKRIAKTLNTNFVIDTAKEEFNRNKLKQTANAILGNLDLNKVDKAQELITNFSKVEIGSGSVYDLMHDEEEMRQALSNEGSEVLVTYPGDLGAFLGKAFQRDALVSFIAVEKAGKTFHLIDLAWRAVRQRRKVYFIAAGDMSRKQLNARFMIRASQHPRYKKVIEFPTDIIKPRSDGVARVICEEREFTKDLDWRLASAAFQKVIRGKLRSDESFLKCNVFPAGTVTVHDIYAMLQYEVRRGWVPDLVVLDYADILAPPRSGLEIREGINQNWIRLRGISQEFHCCVVTATQADAAAYKKGLITRSNFSEDKRKLAHVNDMIGLNSTEEEKKKGIVRWNMVLRREHAYSESVCCHVASCLDIGAPVIRSVGP